MSRGKDWRAVIVAANGEGLALLAVALLTDSRVLLVPGSASLGAVCDDSRSPVGSGLLAARFVEVLSGWCSTELFDRGWFARADCGLRELRKLCRLDEGPFFG